MMNRVFCLTACFWALGGPFLPNTCAGEIPKAVQINGLISEIQSNGRDVLRWTATNHSSGPISLQIPAGLICADADGHRKVLVIRPAILTVPPHAAAEAILPTVALSAANESALRPSIPTAEASPARLLPLLDYAAKNLDLPRQTTQLAALSLLENISFADWQKFQVPQRAALPPGPTPEEIVMAIDALSLVRSMQPGEKPALLEDAELKLRALRNPVTRVRAMELYGMTLPDAPAMVAGGELTAEPGQAPSLRGLLHGKAGDNCPICQARARAAASPNEP